MESNIFYMLRQEIKVQKDAEQGDLADIKVDDTYLPLKKTVEIEFH